MHPLSDQPFDAIGCSSEAVVIIGDGKIKYFSDGAAEIFPKIGKMKPEELFPANLLSEKADGYEGETEIAGVKARVSIKPIGGGVRVFTVKMPQKADRKLLNLMDASCAEYRNTLSVLKMASGLLLPAIEDIGNPKLNKYVAMVYHSYYNMLRMTNNISDYGSILKNGFTLKQTPFDIVAVCREMTDSVSHLLEESGILLVFSAAEDSLVIFADKEKLEKMLLNLFANSIARMPDGGMLRLSAVQAGDRLVLVVTDSGPGIPEDVMATAWNRYRVPKQPGDAKSGIGLGLTIVQAIAQQHGGSAVLESKPGAGTTVTVSIPINKPDAIDIRTGMAVYDASDMQPILTELSDVLPYDKYTQLYMD